MSLGRDYPRYDGMGLASLVARGELHPTELLEEALRRAEAVNPRLGAMVLTMEEEARRQIAQGETVGAPGRSALCPERSPGAVRRNPHNLG